MRDYSKFIPGEEIGAAAPWDFKAVDTAGLLLASQTQAREDAERQAADEVVRQQGYAEGFTQGRAQAMLEAQRQISDFIATKGSDTAKRLAALVESAQRQLAENEQLIARGVLELACDLAQQVLRRELSVNPNALQPVLREALGLLTADAKVATVRLHPQDMDVLDEALRHEFANLQLTAVADPAVSPGGCLVESAGTVVDASLPKRWARVTAALGLSPAWEEAPHAD
jgi:flagellar assembly protein FliH